jgi:hypothetical protein
MRIANGAFCVVLILFAAAQYNDPDYLLWGAIYGIAALFTGVAALRPRAFASGPFTTSYVVALAASFGGMVYYWPDTPGWWVQEVWWSTETAREGMGMMIVVAAMLVAIPVILRVRRA